MKTPVMDEAMLAKIAKAEGETDTLDFKLSFDPSSTGDWCELVKDIVAFANSGGGCIVFGVNDDGTTANGDLDAIRKIDPATVVDKLQKYTDQHFAKFSFGVAKRQGIEVVALAIGGAAMPMVFTATGNYATAGNKQRNAFLQGTVYFRHGAKSEPGTTDDLRAALEREVDRVRSSWLDGIHKVVTAPVGATISVLPGEVTLSGAEGATGVRLVNDADAPAFKAMRTDLCIPTARQNC